MLAGFLASYLWATPLRELALIHGGNCVAAVSLHQRALARVAAQAV